MATPLDEPALLRDTVALRFLVIALAKALVARGSLGSNDVAEQLEDIIADLPDEAEMDHGMTEALRLILSNVRDF